MKDSARRIHAKKVLAEKTQNDEEPSHQPVVNRKLGMAKRTFEDFYKQQIDFEQNKKKKIEDEKVKEEQEICKA